jgi:fatty-acyl-CoA synthase
VVEAVVAEVTGTAEATVVVTPGGKRGSEVDVVLPASLSRHKAAVDAALSGYLFDYKVILPAE